jgi:hypothetical protein
MRNTCMLLIGPVLGSANEIAVDPNSVGLWDGQIQNCDPYDTCESHEDNPRLYTHVRHIRDDEAASLSDSPVLKDLSVDITKAFEAEIVNDEDGTDWVLLTLPIAQRFAA